MLASIFVAASVIAAAAAGLMGWRGLELHDPLRAGFAVMILGLAIALGYEAFALWTRLDPTISRLAALAFVRHPTAWMSFYLAACLLGGALSMHFTFLGRHAHWAVPLVGVAAFVAGAVATRAAGWTP